MVKIKGPSIPPSATPQAKMAELKAKTGKVANTLASLVGGKEEAKKKEKKEATSRSREAENRKKLKSLGKKCGVTADDNLQEATKKIVEGILGDEYDSSENGFGDMVDRIASFIQEDERLEQLFQNSIQIMKSES